MHQPDTLLERIERLEASNRRWKRAGTLLLSTVGALAVLSFARPPAPTPAGVLRGESLELSTPDGAPYARIFLDKDGFPMLAIEKDKAHALLTLNKPALFIRDEDGRRGAFFGFDTRGLGKAELTAANLVQGVRMVLRPDGSAGVFGVDEEGFDRASLEVAADGASQLTVRDPRGEVRGAFGNDAAGTTSMVLLDAVGRRRIGTVVPNEGQPFFSMEDEKEVPRLNATMDFDGAAHLDFLAADGSPGERIP
ncbi:MAG TPA: hypothetical protein ENJ09_01070 [Planctomycetes bacterium]|nr:hypothetical protein [Planctomycetota bacterium]